MDKQLTRKRSRQLAEGSEEVINELIIESEPFIVCIVKRINRNLLAHEDAMQQGRIGMFKSIMRFDSSRGYKLATFAGVYIKMEIYRGMFSISHLHKSAYSINKLFKAFKVLKKELGREPTIAELSRKLKFRQDVVEMLISCTNEVTPDSLEMETFEQVGDLHSEDPYRDIENEDLFQYILHSKTTQRQQELLKLIRENPGMSQAKLGEVLGISQEVVSRELSKIKQIVMSQLTTLSQEK